MPDMSPDAVHKILESLQILAGERLRVQVLNSDGSQKTLIWDDAIPAGKTFNGTVIYTGKLS
jgi:hypothetical protein